MLRSSNRPRIFRCGVIAALLGVASHASASASDDAIARGIELRRARKDAEALEAFRLAERLEPSPRALAQAGLAEQALARWADAERDLSEALAAHDDAWIARNREILNEALVAVQARLGSLELSSDEPAAELWVAGVLVGGLPRTVRVPAGHFSAEVRAPGRTPAQGAWDVVAGQTLHQRVDFAVPVAPPAAAPASPPVLGKPALSAPLPLPAPKRPPPTPSEAQAHTWAWVTLGGATAFVTGGIVAHLVRVSAAASYNDDSRCFFGDQSRAQRCGSELSRAKTSQVLAITGYTAGALLGGISAYLWLRPSAPSESGRVAFSVSPDHAVLSYSASLGRYW